MNSINLFEDDIGEGSDESCTESDGGDGAESDAVVVADESCTEGRQER